MKIVDEPELQNLNDMDEIELEEEEADIELNEDEPPFLQGQTNKTGINLQPVKLQKMPDGSL